MTWVLVATSLRRATEMSFSCNIRRSTASGSRIWAIQKRFRWKTVHWVRFRLEMGSPKGFSGRRQPTKTEYHLWGTPEASGPAFPQP